MTEPLTSTTRAWAAPVSDRIKVAIALVIVIALCSWFGWFNPWNWRAWAALAAGTAIVSAFSWLLKQYDGGNVKW